MIRRPPRSTLSSSSAASDVYKRQVLAYGLAVILAYADVVHPGAGALGGLAVFATILLPVQVGQAAFNNATSYWRRLAVSVPELAIGMAIMGAIGVFWR